jgi:hypothetical protein
MKKRIKTLLLGLCLAVMSASQTQAGLIFTITESGGDVVVNMSGNINLSATSGFATTGTGPQAIRPSGGNIGISVGLTDIYNINQSPSGVPPWTPFGGGGFNSMTSSSGNAVVLFDVGLGVPTGYISGNPLSATGTFVGASFASLGITPGSYTTTFDGAGDVLETDFVTINAVPEPSSVMMVAIAGIGLLQKRRRKS